MTSKTSLIFGCNGQDGSLISKSLLDKNYKVIGVSRQGQDTSTNHSLLGIDKDIETAKGDIKNFNLVQNLIAKYQPDEIYNLAAQSSVGVSFKEPIITAESIINGTINILEASRKLQFDGRIFFAGSSEMFGETKTAADINHIHKPNNPYSIGKQTSYQLVKFYRTTYNLKCVTGVLFNHESTLRKENFVTQKIISGAIKCFKTKTHVLKLGNLDISRDWGWAEEYVEAMQIIARADSLKDHVICTGKSTKLKEFIQIVFNKLNMNWEDHVTYNKDLYRDTDIKTSFGNPKPLEEDLNWKAKVSLRECINKLIDYKFKH
ncbi:GDP-mannose 4,6-dehydratase [Prochlorococcus marinus]|uniref:GDP-mannose 4,6-dehydratase n=1 Tax=Prochlorococcus marinus TaxID=1219 RepID=UPI0022B4F32E|nr:GDP-mannose 4,6-dehydratase [Prochlorococcus marinus]